MDRLDAMSVLVCAIDKGSLSAAARFMGTPLPTVSRKVAELEASLNTTLVIRSRAGLQLTDAGQGFVTAARAILEDVRAAEQAASGEFTSPMGELIVAAPLIWASIAHRASRTIWRSMIASRPKRWELPNAGALAKEKRRAA